MKLDEAIEAVFSPNPMWYHPNWSCDFRCNLHSLVGEEPRYETTVKLDQVSHLVSQRVVTYMSPVEAFVTRIKIFDRQKGT